MVPETPRGTLYVPVRLTRSGRRLLLGVGGFLGTDRRSRGSRLEAGTVLLNTHTQHSLSYTELRYVAWRLGGSPGTVVPMSPNRNDLKPDRRPQEQERARRRRLLIREAYWALFIAIIVVGGAKLVARVFRACEAA